MHINELPKSRLTLVGYCSHLSIPHRYGFSDEIPVAVDVHDVANHSLFAMDRIDRLAFAERDSLALLTRSLALN